MWFEHPAAADLAARTFDVCVVGSGPAGITLARTLAARGRSVLILEAGAKHYDPDSQAAYAGEVVGPLPFALDTSRLRYFGGSSNHWGGFCQALEPADFTNKVTGMATAWPISHAALTPYLSTAEAMLEIPPAPAPQAFGTALRHMTMRYSPPVRFAEKYGDDLRRSSQISIVINACVTGFDERHGQIDSAHVRDPAGLMHAVRARHYVLCAGGIENSRLLLWANQQTGQRIVKDPRTLGRYWFEHPHFTLGEILLNEHAPFVFDAWNIAWVSLTESAMRQHGVLNAGLRITRRDRPATLQLIHDLACTAPELGAWAMQRFKRRLVCGAWLRASWEQAPRPWNRVVLATERDASGMPRAELHWRLCDLDRHTILRSATLLAQAMVAHNYGRVRLDPWLLHGDPFPTDDEIKGNHHMGGTRMSHDSSTGVVNADCRVHGLSNLYVSGSSVFPSGGAANPTLTIVQLALRLADHLSALG